MADKPASGNPQDENVTDAKQGDASIKVSDSKSEETPPEVVASKREDTSAEVSASKPVEANPDIKASNIEEAVPAAPAKPFEVSKEPCNRITAPPPIKSCTCTPKPSLREAFREALHKLCPKSRSVSKTTVVCLDQKKHTDKDSGTQTPPVEMCLKGKDYTKFDGCQKRSDVAKIDSYPAEKLVTKLNPDNKENGLDKPKDVIPKDVSPKDASPKDGSPKDVSPKNNEVEIKTLEELPPCPYPCAPVDNYGKYDTSPKAKEPATTTEPIAKEPEPQEPDRPVEEDKAVEGTAAKEAETPAPSPPEKEEKKPSKNHCNKTPPQTEFCGYRKNKEGSK